MRLLLRYSFTFLVSPFLCLAADPVVQSASSIRSELEANATSAPVVIQDASKLSQELQTVASEPGESSARTLTAEEEIARLEALPAFDNPVKDALLSEVIRGMALQAHMPHFSPNKKDFEERVSFRLNMNPYEMFKVVGEMYGFGMEYKLGAWVFFRINYNELLTKAYTIKYNNLETVTISAPTLANQLTSQMANSYGGSPTQGANKESGSNFSVKPTRLIEEIKKWLAIPTSGAGLGELGSASQSPGKDASRTAVAAPVIDPIWSPDTSQLLVVATRQQHKLIEKYLAMVDQPQALIQINAQFVETSREPSSVIGANWANTPFGTGGAFSLGGQPTSGGTTTTTDATALTPLPLSTNVDLNHIRGTALPNAMLSAPAFSVALQFFKQDRKSSVEQQPSVTTGNNREIRVKATTQQPIQNSSTNFGAATPATSAQIAYLEIGPTIAIRPSVLPGGSQDRRVVVCDIVIKVSSVVGEKIIAGNSYPVTADRSYEFSVPIPDGETLCIAGLDQRTRETGENKIPIFGDIPLVGSLLFKHKSDSLVHTTLLAFITPHVLQMQPPEGPSTAIDLPKLTHKRFDGSRHESIADILESMRSFPSDITALEKFASAVNRDLVLNRFRQFDVEVSLMDLRLNEIRTTEYQNVDLLVDQLGRLKRSLDTARAAVEKITHS